MTIAATSWWVATAEATGAHHIARGMPHEDACAVRPHDARGDHQPHLVVAIADGHGHARHFRSERGARLAVDIATEVGESVTEELAGLADADRIEDVLRRRVGPDVVQRWRSAVATDLEREPVRADEFKSAGLRRTAGFDELIYGYGATLLVAIATGRWLSFLQLGDGDLFVIGPSGAVRRPMPVDPRLDGLRTTSLCQPDAAQSLRYAVVEADGRDVAAAMLATDGYGNAQVRGDWEAAFGADIAALAVEHGERWIGDQLPTWVKRCASADGSGDDVTAALVFADGTTWQTPAVSATVVADTVPDVAALVGAGAAGSRVPEKDLAEAPTVHLPTAASPIAPEATVPIGATQRRPSPRPTASRVFAPSGEPVDGRDRAATRRRLVIILAAATAIAVVALVTLLLVLNGSNGPASKPTPSPSPTASPSASTPSGVPGGPGGTVGPSGPTPSGPVTPSAKESAGART
jgi:hypothetical protein